MNARQGFRRLAPSVLGLIAVIATAGPASAVTYNLVAKPFTATMPGGVTVAMWGFALDTGQSCAETPGWSVGPKLDPGDDLTVNLRNCLPAPTSIVIPGQPMPTVSNPLPSAGELPVRHPPGPYSGRVRSFTGEAAANGGTRTYSWPTLKPGTYVYHSGTHPQVQVQMGLYGAVTKNSGTNQAYPEDPRPGNQAVSYTQQRDLFFSEIDPALHAAVANGTYGTTGPTSTLDYHPKYFLINGVPFSTGTPCIAGMNIGDSVLLRLYNAGLRELAPMMLGSHFQVVAEGGSRLPFNQERYSVLLQPGSTKDLLFQPTQNGLFPIVERRLNLTNNTAPNGGMQTCLVLGNVAPVANNQSVTTNEDVAVPITLTASDPNNDPLTYTVVTPPPASAGTLSGTPPNLTFTPAANFNGSTSFTFTASDGAETSNVATVSITVNPVNDAPTFTLGADQTVTAGAGAQTVTGWATAISPGPANEAGQTVSFLVSNDNNALFSVQPAVSPTGTLTYTPVASVSVATTATVTVQAQDNGGTANGGVNTSAAQTRTITVNPGTAPVANDQTVTTNEDVAVPITLTASDPNNDPLTYTVVTPPPASAGTLSGTPPNLTFTPAANFNGSTSFTFTASDGAETSNVATVSITVNPVNDAPTFTLGGNQTVTLPAGAQTVTNWVTAISPGPANEAGQAVTTSISNNNAALFTAGGQPALTGTGTTRNLTYTPSGVAGTATVTVTATDNGPTGGANVNTSSQTRTITINPAPSAAAILYLSLSTAQTIGGVAYTPADILRFNSNNTFSMVFDGSDVGVGTLAIDAFHILNATTILMSFTEPATIPGIAGTVDDSDIVRFTATSLGPTTAGAFSMYFDGSDVGLIDFSEDIDALSVLSDGRLVISTSGAVSVSTTYASPTSGGSGTTISRVGQDLLVFTPSTSFPLGTSNTAGNWAVYFDGSDVGLDDANSGENIDGADVAPNGRIYLTTTGIFSVPGVSGANEDVFVFTPTSLGISTTGTFSSTLYFDGSVFGLGANNVRDIQVPGIQVP